MASGSSGRPSSGSKGFDFGADDVLCSYEDSLNQESSNGKRVDSSMPGNSGKDFNDGRMRRTLVDMYTPQEESGYQDVISTVEKTMKKYADTLLRFLEGMSGRLSQLELYCYNLERSIGELRSDLVRDHDESDQKLRSLEKHLQEVHRSVQILRDKQELADTQKELAKLQLRQKESTSTHNSHREEDNVAPSASEPKKHDTASDSQNQQLALALPRHPAIPAQPQSYNELPVHQPPPSLPVQQPMAVQTQPNTYYPLQNQMPNQPHVNPHSQPELQYGNQSPQMLEPPRQAAPQPQSSVNPTLSHPYPAYQQQWPQQIPPLQPTPQAPVRSQTPPVYPPYPNQAANPTETFPNSMPMQGPFSPVSQPGISEPVGYGYGGPGRAQQPHHNIVRQPSVQPQGSQTSFGAHLSEGGYPGAGSHPPPSNMRGGYMMYETEGNRASHPSHYAQGGYPQQPPPAGMVGGSRHSGPQVMRNHPFSELMDKAVSMGYARDQVASALRRMEENGQPIDFNTLLDMLNGAPQRAW